MTRIVTSLAVVLVLAIGIDFALRIFIEERAEDRIKSVLDLRLSPDVELGGWPFTLKAISGEFPTVGVSVSDARIEGVELEQIEIALRDVKLSFTSLLQDSSEAVRTGGGTGSVLVTGEALRRALRQQGLGVGLRLRDDGSVVIRDERLPEPVTGSLELDGQDIVISGVGIPRSYRIRLPELVDELRYHSLVVDGDGASIGFSLAPGRLSAPAA